MGFQSLLLIGTVSNYHCVFMKQCLLRTTELRECNVFTSSYLSVHRGGSLITLSHDALDSTLQWPRFSAPSGHGNPWPWHWPCPLPSRHGTWEHPAPPPPANDFKSLSLEICSNRFIGSHCIDPLLVLKSGGH